MSTHTPKSIEDQEIDLTSISKGIGNAFEGLGNFFFRLARFIVKNIFIVILLIIIGAVLGWYLDRGKIYDHQMIVIPNFNSTDYLYSRIELLDAKIEERDTVFFKSIGVSKPKNLLDIKIQPIVDIYRFVNTNELNYRVLELFAEDGDLNQIVEDNATSKNYGFHMISFTTKGKATEKGLVEPLLKFLNSNEFYSKLQQKYIENMRRKMQTNDTLIAQIDAILRSIAESGKGNAGGGTMVYNSQQSQLNDVIRTKDELIEEQAKFRSEFISTDKIIKPNSISLNMIRDKGLAGKMKFIVPILLIFSFMVFYVIRKSYLKRAATA